MISGLSLGNILSVQKRGYERLGAGRCRVGSGFAGSGLDKAGGHGLHTLYAVLIQYQADFLIPGHTL